MLVSQFAIDQFLSSGTARIPITQRAQKIVAETFGAASWFFREPAEVKIQCKLPSCGGYRPFGSEYSQSPDRPDQMETFTASNRTRSIGSSLPNARARLLHSRMLDALDSLEPIAEEITVSVARALAGECFYQKLRGSMSRWSRLQLNYSTPAETKTPLINDIHEDGVFITLALSTGPGLELQLSTGGFAPAASQGNELIAMAGEIAWLLSGGKIPPAYHRVSSASRSNERMALLFFGDIDPRLCIPWVSNEVNIDVDIGSRVQNSANRFGLESFTRE